ncbi:MAG: hypothetical protein KY445_16145 [Armatimonadetes bacterium]|nr:hypothetical protein [Armatimonadota bacterium]
MKINAYILAADPAWVEASLASYYDIVDKIIVSYDQEGRGWTGAPIDVDQCLARLRAIDSAGKMRFVPGHFARPHHEPMANDTFQRQCALQQTAQDADWVLQLDTDEVLPDARALLRVLQATRPEVMGVEWPMRVLFRHLQGTQFLEVCAQDGRDRFEYPGPIAVRPHAVLKEARRCEGAIDRMVVVGDNQSLQVRQRLAPGETRRELAEAAHAIVHNSWARSPQSVRSKIASWSHNEGWKSQLFFYLYWLPSPHTWKLLRNFHPVSPNLWPRLKPSGLEAILSPDIRERIDHIVS